MAKTKQPSVVNVHEAKTHLSKLLARVEQGEEIVLAKAGRPCARLVPVDSNKRERTPGLLRGTIEMDDSFFDPLPEEELRAWEGLEDQEES